MHAPRSVSLGASELSGAESLHVEDGRLKLERNFDLQNDGSFYKILLDKDLELNLLVGESRIICLYEQSRAGHVKADCCGDLLWRHS